MTKHDHVHVLISICLLFFSFTYAFAQAPTGLTATPGNSQVVLTWNSISGAASYNVYRGTSSGQETITAATSLSSPTYTDTGLTNNTVYYYMVKAVISGVERGASNEVVATPTASTTVIADTGPDFSSTQGGKNWYYGYYNSSADYTFNTSSMNYYSGDYGWHYQSSSTFPVVWAHYQQPGNTLPTVRRWKSTIIGTVTISGHVAKSDTRGGDGVVCKILCNGTVLQTYPLNYNDSTGTDFNFSLNASLNDNIDFAVFPNANNAYDATQFIAQISAIARLKSPTNLTATAGSTQINLSWTGVTGASSYNIKRSTDNISYSVIATGVSGTTFTDTSVAANVSYSYYITAVDNKGEGTASNIASATIAQSLTSIAISPVSATLTLNQTQQFSAVGKDQFGTSLASQPTSFNWSVDSGGVGTVDQTGLYNAGSVSGTATIHAVNGSTNGIATVNVINPLPVIISGPIANPSPVTGTTTNLSVIANDDSGESNLVYTWSITGLYADSVTLSNNGTNSAKNITAVFTHSGTYKFMVTVKNQANKSVTGSIQVNVCMPLGVISELTGQVLSDDTIGLTWNNHPEATGYNIKRSTTSGGPYTIIANGINCTSFVDSDLTSDTTYYYVISEVNTLNEGVNSNQVTITPTATIPVAPTILSVTPSNNQVSMSWSPVLGAASYNLYRCSGTSGNEGLTPYKTGLNSIPFVDTGLTNGTTYYYKISAVSMAGESQLSNEISAIPNNSTITTHLTQDQAIQIARNFCQTIGYPITDSATTIYPSPLNLLSSNDYWGSRWLVKLGSKAELEVADINGTIVSYYNQDISTNLGKTVASTPIAASLAIQNASAAIQATGQAETLGNAQCQSVQITSPATSSGNLYFITMPRIYQNIPYADEQAEIYVQAESGLVRRLKLNYISPAPQNANINVTQSTAQTTAESQLSASGITGSTFISANLKWVQPNTFWQSGGNDTPISGAAKASWICVYASGSKSTYEIWVDAQQGQVIGGTEHILAKKK